ncbi:MAG: hypothetical protein MHM6MM_001896 [Cercozoa sp. M6MM]
MNFQWVWPSVRLQCEPQMRDGARGEKNNRSDNDSFDLAIVLLIFALIALSVVVLAFALRKHGSSRGAQLPPLGQKGALAHSKRSHEYFEVGDSGSDLDKGTLADEDSESASDTESRLRVAPSRALKRFQLEAEPPRRKRSRFSED